MRFFSYLSMFLLGGIATYGFFNIEAVSGPFSLKNSKSISSIDLSYTDFLTVMFTGATLVLAGVALIVGVVAIFTYQGIKREARNAIDDETDKHMKLLDGRVTKEIENQAEEKMKELLRKAGRGGELDKALQKALLAIGQGATELTGELEEKFDIDDDGER